MEIKSEFWRWKNILKKLLMSYVIVKVS